MDDLGTNLSEAEQYKWGLESRPGPGLNQNDVNSDQGSVGLKVSPGMVLVLRTGQDWDE